MIEGACPAVGEPDCRLPARAPGNRSRRAASNSRHPFPAGIAEFGRRAVSGEPHDLAVLAARQQRFAIIADGGAEQPVMQDDRPCARVGTVDRAVGEREMRRIAEEGDGEAVTGKIERGDGRHQA